MDNEESRGLLKSVFGWIVRKPQETSAPPALLRSQAWLRADAYLQHESDDFGDDPEQVERTLGALEDLFQYESNNRTDSSSPHNIPYPKLQAIRNRAQHSKSNLTPVSDAPIRMSKRKRENDAAIEQLSHLDRDAKKRRVPAREEPNVGDNIEEPEADFAMLMRKHSVSLDNALRTQWVCVCQKCSGLSVRLSLPQRKKGSQDETCFEVFFGVRNVLGTTLQEAKIMVKEERRASDPMPGVLSNFAHICQSITESLDQRNCLSLALENGSFKKLRPQPKNFGDVQMPRTVSFSALFKRQQELRAGSSALPLKGKRILAVTLATALLPYLETPWVQPSFNHSNIQFYQPLQDGELPDITKPFLAMEHIPIVSAGRMGSANGQTDSDSSKHMVHPNASVLALGILLCELHYCTPIELLQTDTETARNVNTDYYTSLDILKNLEADAGVDYYLATKACLHWEYCPTGEEADFESASVQRLFYQNVVKRLESELFKSWRLRLEDLDSLNSKENEACWGSVGREVVRQQTSRAEPSTTSNAQRDGQRSSSLPATSPIPSYSDPPQSSNVVLQMQTQLRRGPQPHPSLAESSTKSLYFFDASHQTVPVQDTGLSDSWMENLQNAIYRYVDPLDAFQAGANAFKPVRIAILDSGFDPTNPLLMTAEQQLDPRIKAAQSFVHQTEATEYHDQIGHGTHALGLLLQVASCAEIYIAKIASRETLDRESYEDIAKAINHAVNVWNVDIISMSFGIREYSEPMKTAISNALHSSTLMFAAASNDGGNFGRAFPAKYPSVFCIHSTDGNGNPSGFNPTADDKDVNFSLLGEHVRSHWPVGKNGHNDAVNTMSGTSVATPIAAALAASVLSFVRQQDLSLNAGWDELGSWLKDVHSMDAVLKSMVRQSRGVNYDYITPHLLFDPGSSREHVYNKIKDIRKHMYD